jgi:hypothetical protein
MPREIVRINVGSKFPIEVGARFFATIAYPDNRNERERYRLALCRWYIVTRAERDPDFASKLALIVPAIFVSCDHDCIQALKRGNKQLVHRLTATHWLVMPHLRAEKLKPLQVEKDGEFIVPTINKMIPVAMEALGWTGKAKSVPTFKSKIWTPSRPVVHAAAALVLACYQAERLFPIEQQVDSWFSRACLEHPSTIATLIRRSEEYRLKLAEIKQFKIKEEETIQILAEGAPLDDDDSQSADTTQKVG